MSKRVESLHEPGFLVEGGLAVADGVIRPVEIACQTTDLTIGDAEAVCQGEFVVDCCYPVSIGKPQCDNVCDIAMLGIFKTLLESGTAASFSQRDTHLGCLFSTGCAQEGL